jgi:hypothetical protein
MTVNNPTKYDSKCIVLAKYIEKLVLEWKYLDLWSAIILSTPGVLI